MPAKIRLARHGRKSKPFYHIVVADSRAPRDGRFIEKIGTYNPNTNPATIDLDFDKALDWYAKGAQPSDTCRAILSYEGVLYKNHLLGGVRKGALTEDQVETKFDAWKESKLAKIQSKRDSLANKSKTELEKRLDAEAKVKEARSAEYAKRNAELAAEAEAKAKAEAAAKAEAKAKAEGGENTDNNTDAANDSTEESKSE